MTTGGEATGARVPHDALADAIRKHLNTQLTANEIIFVGGFIGALRRHVIDAASNLSTYRTVGTTWMGITRGRFRQRSFAIGLVPRPQSPRDWSEPQNYGLEVRIRVWWRVWLVMMTTDEIVAIYRGPDHLVNITLDELPEFFDERLAEVTGRGSK